MVRSLYKNNWFCVLSVIAVVAVTVSVARTDEAARTNTGPSSREAAEPRPPRSALAAVTIEVPEVSEEFTVAATNPAPVVEKKPGFWIGLKCSPASDALREQLGIPKHRGLVVLEVVGASPAANAGLRRHDVLLRLGNTDLSAIDDLVQAIEATTGRETAIELIRRAKTIQSKVTPIRRPKKYSEVSTERLAKIDDERRKELVARFLNHQEPKKGTRNFRMQFYGPGIVVPGTGVKHAFHGNLNIEVTRTNDGKVKVSLSKDGKVFKTVEGDLRNLPAEFHDALRQTLGWNHIRAAEFDFKIDGTTFGADCKGFIINSKSGNALLIPLGEQSGSAGGWFGVDIPPAGGNAAKQKSHAQQIAALHEQLNKLKKIVDFLRSKKSDK